MFTNITKMDEKAEKISGVHYIARVLVKMWREYVILQKYL